MYDYDYTQPMRYYAIDGDANTLPKAWVKKYEELIEEKGNEN